MKWVKLVSCSWSKRNTLIFFFCTTKTCFYTANTDTHKNNFKYQMLKELNNYCSAHLVGDQSKIYRNEKKKTHNSKNSSRLTTVSKQRRKKIIIQNTKEIWGEIERVKNMWDRDREEKKKKCLIWNKISKLKNKSFRHERANLDWSADAYLFYCNISILSIALHYAQYTESSRV